MLPLDDVLSALFPHVLRWPYAALLELVFVYMTLALLCLVVTMRPLIERCLLASIPTSVSHPHCSRR